MKSGLAAVAIIGLAAFLIPSAAVAGPACTGLNPGDAPSGCIFDLDTTSETGGGDGTVFSGYQFFTTSFTATAASEDVSFAFRETPAYFSFDDACVVAGSTAVTSAACAASSGGFLNNAAFQGSVEGANCGDTAGSPCPVGWGAWIQSVDVSAIGEIVDLGNTGGCGTPGGPPAGSPTNIWWCDGSVQGYDAIYQTLSGLMVGQTYQIGWWLDDNSSEGITETAGSSNQVDMLVYAGTSLPVGSVPIGPPPPSGAVPEPTTYALVGFGLAAMGAIRARKSRNS